MHDQLGVLDQARLDVVSARNDSEQAWIGCVWSSAFSTSIRISRPTRFKPTGTWTMGKNVVRVDDGELLIIRSMARSELRARRCRQRFRPYAVIIPERP